MKVAESDSNFIYNHNRDPITRPLGELWGVSWEDFGDNLPHYNGSTLYKVSSTLVSFSSDNSLAPNGRPSYNTTNVDLISIDKSSAKFQPFFSKLSVLKPSRHSSRESIGYQCEAPGVFWILISTLTFGAFRYQAKCHEPKLEVFDFCFVRHIEVKYFILISWKVISVAFKAAPVTCVENIISKFMAMVLVICI